MVFVFNTVIIRTIQVSCRHCNKWRRFRVVERRCHTKLAVPRDLIREIVIVHHELGSQGKCVLINRQLASSRECFSPFYENSRTQSPKTEYYRDTGIRLQPNVLFSNTIVKLIITQIYNPKYRQYDSRCAPKSTIFHSYWSTSRTTEYNWCICADHSYMRGK